jgi:hypothetical protein
MKLEPIVNPHAKSGQGVQKKTKQEEKDELIEKTKKSTIDKYGVRFTMPKQLRLTITFLTCLK